MVTCYLPGEIIDVGCLDSSKKISVGNGIDKRGDQYVTCQPGLVKFVENKAWVSVHSRRYIPYKEDNVIGIVTGKQGDLFKIDIGYSDLAIINFLSFEGATKRNRPNLKTGDIIYAKVAEASRHLEPELTCIDSVSRAKGLGSLSNGFMFKVSLHLARRLLSPTNIVCTCLGKEFPFEITVGLNGRIWVNTEHSKSIIVIRRIILASEYVGDDDIESLVAEEIAKFKSSGRVVIDSDMN